MRETRASTKHKPSGGTGAVKAMFVPFEDPDLALAVSRCAIGGVDPEAIRPLLAEAIAARRRRGFRRTASYADLADSGPGRGVDAEFYCRILPGCGGAPFRSAAAVRKCP